MPGPLITDAQLPDTFWSAVSYALGSASVLIWLCAQMPQIIKNWRRKSVDGLSIGFLIAWVAGDASNLVGCLLTGQLGVQILLASYYCIVDIILGIQFWVFRRNVVVEVLDGFDPQANFDAYEPDLCDNTNASLNARNHRSGSIAKTRDRIAALLSASLVGSVSRTSAAPIGVAEVSTGPAIDFGFFVAYFSMVMYVTSRWPQIWHNFQRKSTTGVSMLLFTSAFMGNLTYTLSIVLSPQSMGKNAHRKDFLLKELPYIVGAAGTMLFDCIILGQWYYYHRILPPHRRRSTAGLDRISRPYLGTETPTPDVLLIRHAVSGTPRRAVRPSRRFSRRDRVDKAPLLLSHQSVYGSASADITDCI